MGFFLNVRKLLRLHLGRCFSSERLSVRNIFIRGINCNNTIIIGDLTKWMLISKEQLIGQIYICDI